MSKFQFADGKVSDSLELMSVDSISYSFIFKHTDNTDAKLSFVHKGRAENIDPEGLSELDVFDPEGEGNPTEVHLYETPEMKFFIYMPLVVSPIVGICIEHKNSKGKPIRSYKRNLSEF